MSSVWIGRQLGRAKRRVSLRFLPPVLRNDPESLDAIEASVRHQAAAAWHRGLPRVFSFDRGSDEIPPHIVGEAVPGRSLAEIESAREGRTGALFTTEELAWIARSSAEPLEHLHGAGLAHGALVPPSVLVTSEDRGGGIVGRRIVVTGAEISYLAARALARLAHKKRSVWTEEVEAELAKREPYLAPELLDGSAPTPSSDVFALAATLYRLSTGAPPLRGPTLPSADTGDARLDAAIATALAPERDRRFATAAAFLEACELRPAAGAQSGNPAESRGVPARVAHVFEWLFDASPRRSLAIATCGWLIAVGSLGLLLASSGSGSPAQARLRHENDALRREVEALRLGRSPAASAPHRNDDR